MNNENGKLKGFLTRNKIYFETIMSFTLTFMAIFVSILQYNISKNQMSVELNQIRPKFILSTFDEHIGGPSAYKESIIIRNIGAKPFDTKFDFAVFFIFNVANNKYWFSIEHYYLGVKLETSKDSDLLDKNEYKVLGLVGGETEQSLSNVGYYSKINGYLKSKCQEKGIHDCSVGRQSFVRIDYKDQLNNSLSECYSAYFIPDAIRVSEKDCNIIFNDYKNENKIDLTANSMESIIDSITSSKVTTQPIPSILEGS